MNAILSLFSSYHSLKEVLRAGTLLAACCLLVATGCGANPAFSKLPPRPAYASKGDEGSIIGKVLFEGKPPELEPILMTADAACAAAGETRPETVVVDNGRLKNVFVFIRGAGVDSFSFPIGDPVVLDQKDCRYVPHVLGLQAGQTVRIANSDQTSHNVHPSPANNAGFNREQVPGDPPIDHVFDGVDVMIPVRCNQHPWMKASIGVLGHPFFAVTDDQGTFRIDHVPPGDYNLVFWHEVFGEQTASVSVAPRSSITRDATFRAGQNSGQATFLRIAPDLMVPR